MSEELVGRYRVTRRLGAGGLGMVDLAHDTLLDRNVALKRIPTGEDTPEHKKRLLREGQIAAKLDHPNIARLIDCLQLGDELVLVLEYVEGETLGARLRREKKLPIALARHITMSMLAALGHAHRAAVVHRDVKPDNVMLVKGDDALPIVKLLDFGIAKRLDDLGPEKLTETGAAIGTLTYMAPEQALGIEVDARADVYSAGATFFAMVSGAPPVRVGSLADLLHSLCHEDPPPLPDVAPSVAAVAERALAREPGDRFPSADAMRAALEGTTDEAEVPTKTAKTIALPPKPRSYRGYVLAAAALLFAGGAAFALSSSSPSAPLVSPPSVATSAAPPDLPRPSATPSVSVTASASASAAKEAAAPRPPSTTLRVQISGSDLVPGAAHVLETALSGCLRNSSFDIAANGFGRLTLRAGPSGDIEEARYLGYDEPASPVFEDTAARKNRVRFDDFGQCLHAASLGRHIAHASADPARAFVVTFAPP